MLFKYTHTAQWEFPGLRPNLTPARKYLGRGGAYILSGLTDPRFVISCVVWYLKL